jgi:tripartite-type tricarboxylate transporter receptor subunit TctC
MNENSPRQTVSTRLPRRLLLGAGLAIAAPGIGRAQAWPSRPIRVLVGFSAGGPTDLIARMVAPDLQALWGQPIVIENRPGANAIIATEAAARAEADGHTLFFGAGNHTTNPAVYSKLPYETERAFAPIAVAALAPTVLLVHPGTGGIGHFAGEMFKQAASVDLTHVSYRGTAPALQDLLAGVVPTSFATLSTALPLIRDGRLRTIATATESRLPMLPEVPTFAEGGYQGFEATSVWYGLMAPAGVPSPLIQRIAADMAKVLASPALREKMQFQACIPGDEGPDDFAVRIKRELPLWAGIARKASIKLD